VTPNKGSGPPIWRTIYISEVNGARKVKYGVQVAMNKNSDQVQKFFLRGGWEDSAAIEIFPCFWNGPNTIRARKLTFGLQINIYKANSRRHDVTQ